MDVQRRDDRFLDELLRMYDRRQVAVMQLRLWEYTYPNLKPFCDDIRKCLVADDS